MAANNLRATFAIVARAMTSVVAWKTFGAARKVASKFEAVNEGMGKVRRGITSTILKVHIQQGHQFIYTRPMKIV